MLLLLKSWLRPLLLGDLFVVVAYLVYTISIRFSIPRTTAIGSGAWYAWTVQSPLFWLLIGLAFVSGMYLSMRLWMPR
jgi:hypothetical protein